MAIERSIPYESLSSATPDNIEGYLNQRHITGQGFDELSQTVAFRLSAMSLGIQEHRPLFFVIKHADGLSSITERFGVLVADVAESLAIPLEPDQVTFLELKDLDDDIAQQIINDGRRPLIQPLSIGRGEHPKWWLGPQWIFPNRGPVETFRRQFKENQL